MRVFDLRPALSSVLAISIIAGSVLLEPVPALAAKTFETNEATGRQLLHYLDHPDWNFRLDAINEIGKRKLLQAEEVLVEIAVEDPYEPVRGSALRALSEIGSEQVVPVAEETARNDTVTGLRAQALDLLEAKGNERCAPTLGLVLSTDSEASLRKKAATILRTRGWIGQNSAIIKAASEDEDAGVREAARNAFVLIGGSAHREGLHAVLLRDPDPMVREQCVRKIGKGPVSTDRLPLLQALDDPDSEVAILAARALGRLGDKTVARILREKALDQKDAGVAEAFNEAAATLGR